jgi:Transposase IS116/IS110/IS902 family
VIIAETGIDMARFPTPGHLASWARFVPAVKESAGKPKGKPTTGHGNPYLARVLGEAAVAAGRTNTFLGERYRRIARRRGAKLPVREGSSLTGERCLGLFDAQVAGRHLDLAARWLRGQGKGFYTIASAGHEGNAAVAAALRPTDPALVRYRSGAFYVARGQQVPEQQPLRDVLLGVVAAAEELIAGGRHKVFGHPAFAVIPQISTIASHLPRAVGVAFAIERAKRLGVACAWPSSAMRSRACEYGWGGRGERPKPRRS